MTNDMWAKLADAVQTQGEPGPTRSQILDYRGPSNSANEAVFFFKPELCSDARVDFAEICRLTSGVFERFQVKVVAASAMNGPYLEKHNIMSRHYGLINLVSMRGFETLSSTAIEKLRDTFPNEMKRNSKILGGHQFLEEYPFFSAEALSVLWDTKNASSVRIASGTYALSFRVFDDDVIILNGFHPYQLMFYTRTTQKIVCMIVQSSTPWASLRGQMIGTTNPRDATDGSIRKLLFDRKTDLNIAQIDKGLNGVHLSAGPVEAFFEIERFFGLTSQFDWRGTNFGATLVKLGLGESQVNWIRANPVISLGDRTGALFDLTEDVELGTAANMIARLPI